MNKKYYAFGIFLIAAVVGLFGYVFAKNELYSYFRQFNDEKRAIIVKSLKSEFFAVTSISDKRKLEDDMREYLDNIQDEEVEAIIVKLSGEGGYHPIFKEGSEKIKEEVGHEISIYFESVEAHDKPFSETIGKGGYTLTGYARTRPANYSGNDLSEEKMPDEYISMIAVLKNNEFQINNSKNFGVYIGGFIFLAVLLIAFFLSVVDASKTIKYKNQLTKSLDDIITHKTSKLSFSTPFKDEILTVIDLVNEMNSLKRDNGELQEKINAIKFQNKELISKLDKSSRELNDISYTKEKIEKENYELINYVVTFVDNQKEKIWLIQQFLDKITHDGLIELVSSYVNNNAVERESIPLFSIVEELSTLNNKKDIMHTIVAQLNNKVQDFFSLTDLYTIESRAHSISEKFNAMIKKSEQFEETYDRLQLTLDNINKEAFRNRLLMSQNYKSFMEKLSDMRKKVNSHEAVKMEDVDQVHLSYRVALNSFKLFIDNILNAENMKQGARKEYLNLHNIEALPGDLLAEIDTYKKHLKEKSEPILGLTSETIKIIKYVIEIYYNYVDNMNSDIVATYLADGKKNMENVKNLQNWNNKIASLVEGNLNLLDELGRHLH